MQTSRKIGGHDLSRDEWAKEAAGPVFPLAGNMSHKAHHASVMGEGTAAWSSKRLAATLQANKRWQASLEQLAKSPDTLRSIRSEQQKFLEELRERRVRELAQAAQARLSALERARQAQLYRAIVGVVSGSLGFANSKTLAGAALRFLELENTDALPSWEHWVRFLSLVIYLAPAGTFILGATAGRRLKVRAAALVASNCLVFGNLMTRQRAAGTADACGVAGAFLTTLLLLWLWRKDSAVGELPLGQNPTTIESAQKGTCA